MSVRPPKTPPSPLLQPSQETPGLKTWNLLERIARSHPLAHYNQEVRFSSAVKCKKWPQVLPPLLDQRRNHYYYYLR